MGSRVTTGRQFSIWRCQIRSPSAGPIRPRSIAFVARSSSKARASSDLSGK